MRLASTGLREKLAGTLLALYVLSGRWGIDRLLGAMAGEDALSPFQLRLWITAALLAVAVADRGGKVAPRAGAAPFTVAVTALLAWMCASTLWAEDAGQAVMKATELVIILVASLATFKLVTGARATRTRAVFWGALFALTGALAVMATVRAVVEGPARLAVLGGGPNVFGRFMALATLASLYLWRREGSPLYVASSVYAGLLLVLTGSRGGMLALVAAVGGFFAAERVRLRRLVAFAVVGLSVGAGVFTQTGVGKRAIAVYDQRVNRLLIEERYTSGRGELYQAAYELGLRKPVAGWGLGGFKAQGLAAYPHNVFLELFSETGGVGVGLFVAVLMLFVWRCAHSWRTLDGASVAGAVFALAAAQFSGDFYDSRTVFVFMALSYIPKDAEG